LREKSGRRGLELLEKILVEFFDADQKARLSKSKE
jgi:hypothetical protein